MSRRLLLKAALAGVLPGLGTLMATEAARAASGSGPNLLAAATAEPGSGSSIAQAAQEANISEGTGLYISGARHSAEEYVAVIFDESAQAVATLPLPARAHGAASHRSSHRACLFARRPGMYMSTFDRRRPSEHQLIEPVDGRHYYGHGSYSQDGKLLFTTENDFDAQRGVLGIHDAEQGYRRVGEIDSFGVGPHEVIRVPGTRLLVVANGGIQTHPDSGREKLNIATMEPSLAVLDSNNGKLLAFHVLAPELHQVSIRHLACSSDGVVWFAGQYEGQASIVRGLAGSVNIEQSMLSFQAGRSVKGLSLIDIPDELQMRMAYYLSSVALSPAYALFTSSRGGVVLLVDRRTGRLAQSVSLRDCSGVCPDEYGGALLSSGSGEIVSLDDNGLQSLGFHNVQWDNHMYPV